MKFNKKIIKLIMLPVGFILAGICLTYLAIYFSYIKNLDFHESGIKQPDFSIKENQIVLVTQKPKDSPAGIFLNLVYNEAFRRMEKEFVYKYFPAKRASLLSDSGKVDGELSRIYSYNDLHTDVVRVEESHWKSGFIAVAINPSIKLDSWECLKDTNYRVDYIRGIKGCEVNLPKVVKAENLEVVDDTSSGFSKLIAGRTDIFIGAEMDVLDVLESDIYKESGLKIVGIMERFTGHAFLHKKRKDLSPELSEILKDMKKEGLFRKYRDAAGLKSCIDN